MEHTIFFHEDFYKQIELLPQENYFAILNNAHSDLNNKDDYGFISIIERGEQKIRTEGLSIQFEALKQKLEKFAIEKYDTVKTGYGNTIITKENTVALGFERIAIFFELTEAGIIKNIWLCQSIDLPKISIDNNLFNALSTLGMEYNLILVDWNEEVAIRLSSTKAVQIYLRDNFAFNFPSLL